MRVSLLLFSLYTLTVIVTVRGAEALVLPRQERIAWLSRSLNVGLGLAALLNDTTTLLQQPVPCPDAAQLLLTGITDTPCSQEAKAFIAYRSLQLRAIIAAKKSTTPNS